MLDFLQRGHERLYRLEPAPDVRDFLIDEAGRAKMGLERLPREQLLLRECEDALEVALFMDRETLARLERNDPRQGVGEHNLADLCLALEGVSHFVYVTFRAGANVRLSGLELELQAEVDKYVTCVLLADGKPVPHLHARLFEGFRFADDLSAEERERYETANRAAARYAAWLEDSFVEKRRIPEMLAELRRYYRMGLQEKLAEAA